MRDRFLRRLVSNMRCSVCGQHYNAGNVNVLGHQDDLWFLSVFCPSCRTHGLVAAMAREGRPSEVITDLTEEEYSRFLDMEAIGIDDVLDMHNLLKDFQGDPSDIFSKK